MRRFLAGMLLLAAINNVHAQVATGSAGEGSGLAGGTSSPQSAGYSCDPAACKLPSCLCASTSPPGGLAPSSVPQFITFTADDGLEVYTTSAINQFLAHRTNNNNCSVKNTFFASLNFTNYSMVTDWYVAGNEIADHTMTHVGTPPSAEILGNLKALNAFSGIPLSEIIGFRAPFLAYNADTLTQLHSAGFTYDSSATSASQANATDTDAFWPYTLDHGFANDCLEVTDVCQGKVKLHGLWEIPLYATFESPTSTGIHLMDPWLDSPNMDVVLSWLKYTFLTHYDGNRQPFGLYTHPIHLATGYPGLVDPLTTIAMLNAFLDWAQALPDVWIVSNKQLLAWMQSPVANADIASSAALKCARPDVDASLKICNGIETNEQGLLVNCPFADFAWTTCYGCPQTPPSPSDPAPAQNTSLGGVRFRLPANCSTAFWDPVGNECHCTDGACAFTDESRPIGNYSEGGAATTTATTAASASATAYKPFTSNAASRIVATAAKGLVAVSLVSFLFAFA